MATTTISGATVLLGHDLRPERVDLMIDGGHIAAVGPDLPASEATVEATGYLLVPGFIDAHVHIGFVDPGDVVRGGVTTVRDLAWPPADIWPLVADSARPDFNGPRIIAAGQMLTAPGGYPTTAGWAPPGTGLEVNSPSEAMAAVARQAEAGAAVIKVALNPPAGPVLDDATLAAIVSAASERNLKVTGHVHGLDQLEKALDSKMDELAHMLMSEEEIPPRTIERMVATGMVVVPTLSVREGRDLELAIQNLTTFIKSGGEVVYGTDLGNEGPRPGIDAREGRGDGSSWDVCEGDHRECDGLLGPPSRPGRSRGHRRRDAR